MAIDQGGPDVQIVPEQDIDRKIEAGSRAQDPIEAGSFAWRPDSFGSMMRMPTRARRLLPLGDDIGHHRIIRVDRLDDGKAVGMGPLHFHRNSWRRNGYKPKGRDKIAPSTPTSSIAATISSPVT